jgi:hypothetical protein
MLPQSASKRLFPDELDVYDKCHPQIMIALTTRFIMTPLYLNHQ